MHILLQVTEFFKYNVGGGTVQILVPYSDVSSGDVSFPSSPHYHRTATIVATIVIPLSSHCDDSCNYHRIAIIFATIVTPLSLH